MVCWALNLNIHFHMLFLDGAYLVHTRPPVFRCVAPPSDRKLPALVQRIAERVGRALEAEVVGSMDDLIGHSITYRIVVGPRAGQKVFALQSVVTGGVRDRDRALPGLWRAAGSDREH
jgi:hypothetical protein